MYKYKMMKQ